MSFKVDMSQKYSPSRATTRNYVRVPNPRVMTVENGKLTVYKAKIACSSFIGYPKSVSFSDDFDIVIKRKNEIDSFDVDFFDIDVVTNLVIVGSGRTPQASEHLQSKNRKYLKRTWVGDKNKFKEQFEKNIGYFSG
jgi:hypothetical protein